MPIVVPSCPHTPTRVYCAQRIHRSFRFTDFYAGVTAEQLQDASNGNQVALEVRSSFTATTV